MAEGVPSGRFLTQALDITANQYRNNRRRVNRDAGHHHRRDHAGRRLGGGLPARYSLSEKRLREGNLKRRRRRQTHYQRGHQERGIQKARGPAGSKGRDFKEPQRVREGRKIAQSRSAAAGKPSAAEGGEPRPQDRGHRDEGGVPGPEARGRGPGDRGDQSHQAQPDRDAGAHLRLHRGRGEAVPDRPGGGRGDPRDRPQDQRGRVPHEGRVSGPRPGSGGAGHPAVRRRLRGRNDRQCGSPAQ